MPNSDRDCSKDDSGPWGPWFKDGTHLTTSTPYEYSIPIAELKGDAREAMDWFRQIAEKTWGSDEHLAGLVRAATLGNL